MNTDSKQTKERKFLETENVIDSIDSIIDSFSGTSYELDENEKKKYKGIRGKLFSFIHDRDDDISRKFPSGELTTKKIIFFAYQCISSWDKICLVLSIIIITYLGWLVPLMTHIIISPTLNKFDYKILVSGAIFLCCICISKIIGSIIFLVGFVIFDILNSGHIY